MRIIKQGGLKSTVDSLMFFREHYQELGRIKYVILYFAEREWSINKKYYH